MMCGVVHGANKWTLNTKISPAYSTADLCNLFLGIHSGALNSCDAACQYSSLPAEPLNDEFKKFTNNVNHITSVVGGSPNHSSENFAWDSRHSFPSVVLAHANSSLRQNKLLPAPGAPQYDGEDATSHYNTIEGKWFCDKSTSHERVWSLRVRIALRIASGSMRSRRHLSVTTLEIMLWGRMPLEEMIVDTELSHQVTPLRIGAWRSNRWCFRSHIEWTWLDPSYPVT